MKRYLYQITSMMRCSTCLLLTSGCMQQINGMRHLPLPACHATALCRYLSHNAPETKYSAPDSKFMLRPNAVIRDSTPEHCSRRFCKDGIISPSINSRPTDSNLWQRIKIPRTCNKCHGGGGQIAQNREIQTTAMLSANNSSSSRSIQTKPTHSKLQHDPFEDIMWSLSSALPCGR